MKYVGIMFISLLIVLSGCVASTGDGAEADGVIQKAELSTYEEDLTDLVGAETFVFDLNVKNENVQKVRVGVEYYEDGEFVDDIAKTTVSVDPSETDEMRLVFLYESPEDDVDQWAVSLMSENGSADVTNASNEYFKDRKKISWRSTGGITEESPLKLNDKEIIGTIVYSNENSVTIYNTFIDEKQKQSAIDYEHVYLLTVELLD